MHAHPPYATTLAIMGREIPAVHYMVAVAGGDTIRCAPYATFGTEELSRHAVKALAERLACLLAHHGMIAAGPSLAKAMWLAVEVETLAAQYHAALQIGKPPLLSKEEIEKLCPHGRLRPRGQVRVRAADLFQPQIPPSFMSEVLSASSSSRNCSMSLPVRKIGFKACFSM